MLDHKGFDLWVDGYDRSVNLSGDDNAYPFAGYKRGLARSYEQVRQGRGTRVLDIGFGTGVLFSFQQIDMGESILNEGYSLKEYPDRSCVLRISVRNGSWLCEYSPPRRCSDTALTDAIESGFVVMADDLEEVLRTDTEGGGSIRHGVHHHTLDRSISSSYTDCEVFEQDEGVS